MSLLDNALDLLREKSTVFTKVFAHFPLIENGAVGTAGVAGDRVYWNRSFFEGMSDEDRAFVLAHEVYHILDNHPGRLNGRDPMRWNIAADYAVNNGLVEDYDMVPPAIGCLVGKYVGLSAEEVYVRLPQQKQETMDNHGQWGKAAKEFKEQLKKLAASLTQHERNEVKKALEKMYGREAGRDGVLYECRVLEQTDLLQRLVLEKTERDLTWRLPNRRMYQQGVYLPSRQREKVRLCICIDTSGSTQGPLVQRFVDLVRGILRSGDVEATIIQCDAEVQRVQKMKEFDGRIYGGGGTDFAPALAEAEKQNARIVLYMTDLQGNFPSSARSRVVWVVPEGAGSPPFGRVVELS